MKTEAAFDDIKKALSLYFAKRVSDDMDALWDNGEWSSEKNQYSGVWLDCINNKGNYYLCKN